jgi:hypothetical protein
MLLGALASCLVHTYLLQACVLGIPLDGVEVEIHGALDMTGVVGLPVAGPITLEGLRYIPRISSPAPAADIAGLHAAVDSACAVLNTLRMPMSVTRGEDNP